MITISVMGGLGNQMFQYAAARALAETHGVGVGIDLSTIGRDPKRSYLLDRLSVPERPLERASHDIAKTARAATALRWHARGARALARLGLRGVPQLPGAYVEKHFHFDPDFFRLGPDIRLHGYFQSEHYFAPIAGHIREAFRPREPFGEAARQTADAIARAALPVSIHIRRGDYIHSVENARVHGILHADYYGRALQMLADRLGAGMTLFVFSDDPDAAREVFARLPDTRAEFVSGDPQRPWEDMALMARCRHHVIANSSFSWWGAWLDPSPDKIVIGPRQWFAPAALRRFNTCDLCPSGWILV